MESKLHALLCSPSRIGGYGFPQAVLNHDIRPGRNDNLTEQKYYSVDICWPRQKVGVEYFGEAEHQDAIHDRRRLDALGALGWKIVVIDKWRLYDPASLDVAVRQIAKHLGRRMRFGSSWTVKNAQIRRDLGLC